MCLLFVLKFWVQILHGQQTLKHKRANFIYCLFLPMLPKKKKKGKKVLLPAGVSKSATNKVQ
jgi:hypothetical protein